MSQDSNREITSFGEIIFDCEQAFEAVEDEEQITLKTKLASDPESSLSDKLLAGWNSLVNPVISEGQISFSKAKLEEEEDKMADKDYAPLSSTCVRALCDKMYDKRKAAALEIEKLTKDCIAVESEHHKGQVEKLLRVLGKDFAESQNPNMRKGGLIGLAAMAIGMGPQYTGQYVEQLMKPVLKCMDDSDSRVRFYSCESLYNVTKVTRDNILPLFDDIFVGMTKVVVDLDQSVRTAAELLDRLLKDIITENEDFSTENFIPTLKKAMYTEDPFGRSFCLGWIHAMHKVPNPTVVSYLPVLIDPMFLMLQDAKSEIYVKCQNELETFLKLVKQDPPEPEAFDVMVQNLVNHVQSRHIRVQTMAIHWYRAFVSISASSVFPFTSGILSAILPNLSFDEEKRRSAKDELEYKRIRIMSKKLYMDLMELLQCEAKHKLRENPSQADLEQLKKILEVATDQLQHGRTESKIGALKWINLLFNVVNAQMACHIDAIFPTLLTTLSDANDEVVILDLRVLAVICKPTSNKHFHALMISLYTLFKADRLLLESKGAYIIRQLSIYLSPEDIYKSMAEMVQKEKDLKFSRLLVEYLNTILFTTPEVQSLRDSIKHLGSPESIELFVCLHKTWSHSQASTLALVFLAGCYNHALVLSQEISHHEITIEFLYELDRFIQILESPIFSFLRAELLDGETNTDLIRALYGLLNLMPQTKAFKTLNDRLKTLPNDSKSTSSSSANSSPKKVKKGGFVGNKHPKDIDFQQLLSYFVSVQSLHEEMRHKEISDDILNEEDAARLFEMKLSEDETIEFSVVDDDEGLLQRHQD